MLKKVITAEIKPNNLLDPEDKKNQTPQEKKQEGAKQDDNKAKPNSSN